MSDENLPAIRCYRPDVPVGPAIRHDVTGAGPVLVLIHPQGYDSRTWHRLSPVLAERFTVVVFDRPGHGRSVDELALRRVQARTREQYAELVARQRPVEHDVATIERMLRDAGRTTFSVVGVGDGGLIALMLAARAQVHVEDVVLVDTPVGVPEDLTVEEMLDQLEESGLDGPAHVDMVERFLRTREPEPWVDAMLGQIDPGGVPDDDRALMRTMLIDNGVSVMLTVPSPGTGDLDGAALAAITGRVLALRVGARSRRMIAPIGSVLPRATSRQLDLPEAAGLYPLTHAHEAALHIIEFLAPPDPSSDD